ncbi:MAG: hypothetical protein JW993_01330 [Sedimentisphaerales bacterium]|nr:hypothetical protein [Sedimentisphaerales bacterium]
MRLVDIEAWVLRVVDQVNGAQPCEDSRVELKAEWPQDANRAARRIAAHANAVAGEDILWIIGLDESRGVIGADNNDLASWFPAVVKQFDGLAPSLTDVNVPVGDKTVVALLFTTDRAPFVVRNSAAGPIDFEVPWREGCRTRSARREDLIRLLSPIGHLPAVEVLDATVAVWGPSPSSQQQHSWDIALKLYVAPREPQRLVIPCHKCEVKVQMDDRLHIANEVWLEPRVNVNSQQHRIESLTVACTKTEAIINGPGILDVKAHTTSSVSDSLPHSNAELIASLIPAGYERPITIVESLRRTEARFKGQALVKWIPDK